MDWLSGWSYRKEITIDNTKVMGSTNHSDFVAYVKKLNDSDLRSANVQSAGEDIRFTLSDGTTLLDYHFQSFENNIVDGSFRARVKIPTLSFDTDTILYMYYGNNTALDAQDSNAVWSDYAAVWYLNNNPIGADSILDYTANPRHGTPTNGVVLVDGKTGKALDFDGDDDYVELGNIQFGDKLMMNGQDLAISAILKPRLTGDPFQRIVSKSDAAGGEHGYELALNGQDIILYIDGARAITSFGMVTDPTKFYHITATKHTTLDSQVFLDGILVNTNPSSRAIPNHETNMRIGTWNHAFGRELNSILEMVTISSIIPSAERNTTEYNNNMEHDTFLSFGSHTPEPISQIIFDSISFVEIPIRGKEIPIIQSLSNGESVILDKDFVVSQSFLSSDTQIVIQNLTQADSFSLSEQLIKEKTLFLSDIISNSIQTIIDKNFSISVSLSTLHQLILQRSFLFSETISISSLIKTIKSLKILDIFSLSKQSAVPISDSANSGGWDDTEFGNNDGFLFDELDEIIPDDITAVSLENTAIPENYFEVGISSLNDPNQSHGHKILFRARGNGFTKTKVEIYQGTTLIATTPEFILQSEYTTHEYYLSEEEVDNITDYSSLKLRVIPLSQ